MGGGEEGTERTSELIKDDGTVEEGFDLRYDTA